METKEESNLERARTAAGWGLMVWEQTRAALNKDHNDPTYADRNPDVVIACMQAGSIQPLVRALDELRRAVDAHSPLE